MIIKQSKDTGTGGSLRLLRLFFPLAIVFVLFVMAYSPVSAQMTCDVKDPTLDYSDPKNKGTFLCRDVPEYYIDNSKAKVRLIEEITRRKRTEEAGGARFTMPNPLVNGTRGNYGYRCPDAQGECLNVWINSPGGTKGLSNPLSFAYATNTEQANVHIQRISDEGIGNQDILDENPIDAINIWGDAADTSRTVCFLGRGRIRFVDTDRIPSQNWILPTTVEGEGDNARTCAHTEWFRGRGQFIFLPPD